MKKIFKIADPKIKPDRKVEAIKSEIRKYLKRERNKECPEGVDFWDFDCKIGADAQSAEGVHYSAISKAIDAIYAQNKDSFYLEIIAKPAVRKVNAKSEAQ